jgi:heterodisulfide reductase subunit A-like polyferredoxin
MNNDYSDYPGGWWNFGETNHNAPASAQFVKPAAELCKCPERRIDISERDPVMDHVVLLCKKCGYCKTR